MRCPHRLWILGPRRPGFTISLRVEEHCRLTSGFGMKLFAVTSLGKTPWRNPLLASYWTLGAVRHGEYVAKLRITPEPSAAAQVRIRDLDPLTNPEAVRDSLVAEIGEHDHTFELQAQLCVDPLRMPIQNTSIEWSEMLSRFTKIAIIHIPKQGYFIARQSEHR